MKITQALNYVPRKPERKPPSEQMIKNLELAKAAGLPAKILASSWYYEPAAEDYFDTANEAYFWACNEPEEYCVSYSLIIGDQE